MAMTSIEKLNQISHVFSQIKYLTVEFKKEKFFFSFHEFNYQLFLLYQ